MKKTFGLFIIMLSMMLFNSNVLAYEEYKVGDKIEYNGEDYYVINSSDSSVDYVTLLKANPLTVEDLYKYGTDENGHLFVNEYIINKDNPEEVVDEYEDGSGGMAYYTSETCSARCTGGYIRFFDSDYITTGCTVDYDNSDVKKVVDNWSNLFSEDLKEVNGYKARLLNFDDLINYLGYQLLSTGTYKSIYTENDSYSWLVGYNKYRYWTMEAFEDSDNSIYVVDYFDKLMQENSLGSYAVRPVINLKKCALGDSDNECLVCANGYNYKTEKVTRYKEYNIGDEIEYLGEKYYVIKNSNGDENYVTLLKENPLTQGQIDSYSNLEYDNNTMISSAYYTSPNCSGWFHFYDLQDCIVDYSSSNVKALVDKWISIKFNDEDLVNVDGYKARLMTEEEFKSINLSWLKDYSYWLMNGMIHGSFLINEGGPSDSGLIRPVINLSKDKIDDQEEFQIGDIVTYNNDNYYVIEDSDASKNYVVLLKEIPLRLNDINNGEIGNFLYYKGDTCSSSDKTGCTSNYDESSIKVLVNNWASNELNDSDLVEVDGYKVRLIMLEELRDNLGYEPGVVTSTTYYRLTDYVPSWVYDDSYSYWTMSGYEDKNEYVYKVGNNGFIYTELAYNNSAVRPVINLDKCVLDGGCWEETVEVKECIGDNVLGTDDPKTTVSVGNTLKIISNIVFIISIILIIGGLGILGYNYIKSKKELKK